MDRGFKIVDHTADVGIEMWGETPQAVLEAAALGMLSLIVNLKNVKYHIEKTLVIEADSLEDLLLNWLREILYIQERERIVFSGVSIPTEKFSCSKSDKYCFYGLLKGEKLNLKRHDICMEIKAVTRHQMFFQKKSQLWRAGILFDI